MNRPGGTTVNRHKLGAIVAGGGLAILVAACGDGAPAPASGTQATAPPIAAQDPPVTLRLGIADTRGRLSEPAAVDFVERVSALSEGNITIEPVFDAGEGGNLGFETGVNEKVKRGDLELGMTGARSWDLSGVSSLQALQAPFLIDSDALALAVAKSDISTRALDGMSSAGVAGLAMWPEDLRHLFSFPKCEKDFRTPEGIAGSTILVLPSKVSRDVVAALGGVDYPEDERGEDADACRLHGMESGLRGQGLPVTTAVTTGNVVLFPKYQVLVANADALSRLSDGQQAILRRAAEATQTDAFTRQPSEVKLAEAWCKGGGTVQLASVPQRAALVEAAASVRAALEQDPLARQLIADIVALKLTVDAKPFGTPCEPPVAEATLAPVDTTGFNATAIPDGVYRANLTQDDLLALGASPRFASMNWGVKTWTFAGNAVSLDQGENGGPPCYGSYEIIPGKHLAFVTDRGECGIDGYYLWRADGDGIRFLVIPVADWSVRDNQDNATFFEGRVWSRID
jgi:TRAP-type C4-dicarboxylate transport system substrate-binding protein